MSEEGLISFMIQQHREYKEQEEKQ